MFTTGSPSRSRIHGEAPFAQRIPAGLPVGGRLFDGVAQLPPVIIPTIIGVGKMSELNRRILSRRLFKGISLSRHLPVAFIALSCLSCSLPLSESRAKNRLILNLLETGLDWYNIYLHEYHGGDVYDAKATLSVSGEVFVFDYQTSSSGDLARGYIKILNIKKDKCVVVYFVNFELSSLEVREGKPDEQNLVKIADQFYHAFLKAVK